MGHRRAARWRRDAILSLAKSVICTSARNSTGMKPRGPMRAYSNT
jgi:hypothetical protein